MFPAGYVIAAIAVMLTFGAAGDKEGGGAGDVDFTVIVSGSATTVPEPASPLLLGVGFLSTRRARPFLAGF